MLSESKGALAGFLAGAGALVKRTVFKAAHRSSMVQTSGTGGLRNALTGVAITSVAVAAALITPHALSTPHTPAVQAAPASTLTNPKLPLGAAENAPKTNTPSTSGSSAGGSDGTGSGSGGAGNSTPHGSSAASGSGDGSGTKGGLSGLPNAGGLTTPVITGLGQATTNLTNTVSGLATTVTQIVSGLTKGVTPSNSNAAPSPLSGLGGTVKSLLQKVLK